MLPRLYTTKELFKDSEPRGLASQLKSLLLVRYAQRNGVARRRHALQRLFSTFPGGWPGVGLLLLRAAVGVTAMIQGGMYLTDGSNQSLQVWLAGTLTIASGIALFIGLLTPLSAAMVALATIGVARSWFPTPTLNLFTSPLAAVLVVI